MARSGKRIRASSREYLPTCLVGSLDTKLKITHRCLVFQEFPALAHLDHMLHHFLCRSRKQQEFVHVVVKKRRLLFERNGSFLPNHTIYHGPFLVELGQELSSASKDSLAYVRHQPQHMRSSAAGWEGNLDVIKVLADNKVDLGTGDYDGRTPLHLAACAGHTSVIEYLINQPSVVVNAVDRFGGTPLEDAIRHGKAGAAALLREMGGCRSGDAKLERVENTHEREQESK